MEFILKTAISKKTAQKRLRILCSPSKYFSTNEE